MATGPTVNLAVSLASFVAECSCVLHVQNWRATSNAVSHYSRVEKSIDHLRVLASKGNNLKSMGRAPADSSQPSLLLRHSAHDEISQQEQGRDPRGLLFHRPIKREVYNWKEPSEH